MTCMEPGRYWLPTAGSKIDGQAQLASESGRTTKLKPVPTESSPAFSAAFLATENR